MCVTTSLYTNTQKGFQTMLSWSEAENVSIRLKSQKAAVNK